MNMESIKSGSKNPNGFYINFIKPVQINKTKPVPEIISGTGWLVLLVEIKIIPQQVINPWYWFLLV